MLIDLLDMAAPLYGMPIPSIYLRNENDPSTFQLEETFPSLPVPSLHQTLAKYLESVRPLVTEDEFMHTKNIVQKFALGVGRDLHEDLLKKAKEQKNWLYDWWEEHAYLRQRIPHSPFGNFCGLAPDSDKWPKAENVQCRRSALVTWYMIQFWQALHRESLPIDKGGKTTNWSMHQFSRLFSGCKTPGESVDRLNDYFKTARLGSTPTHLLVTCRGRLFTFSVVDSRGHVITAPELEQYFTQIRRMCDDRSDGQGLGALTAAYRSEWFRLRNHLISLHPDNEQNLMIVQTSLFVVALDEQMPSNGDELMRESLVGEARNRWFDKTFHMIAFKNGKIGLNCDHSPFDGMVSVAMFNFTYLGLDACGYQWKGPMEWRDLHDPKELVFHIDDRISRAVIDACHLFKQGGDSVELVSRSFCGYGKNFLRENNIHPDTFVQMALHYAYMRLHVKPAPAYETASTRKFYRGRTETVRSCTAEVIAWVRAMLDNNTMTRQRLKMLRSAMDKHMKLMAEAQESHGCDRHLFGLELLAQERDLPMPDIYTDPSYEKSGGHGNFILSTSCIGYTSFIGAVVPMCKNGYGFFYGFLPEQINTCVTSWAADDTSAAKLFDSLCQSFDDMKQLVLCAAESKL